MKIIIAPYLTKNVRIRTLGSKCWMGWKPGIAIRIFDKDIVVLFSRRKKSS